MSSKKPLLIAVDGPAASGKGTIAKRIAEHFDLDYLDTGSIYRALGYKILNNDLDPSDNKVAIEFAKNITEEDIKNPHLYDEGIGKAASIVAAIPDVRQALLGFQRVFARSPKGAILDGRDIGTVICPEADFKFFITADLEARAERRYKQLQNKGLPIIYQSVKDDLRRRDDRDSKRDVAPLKRADDAIYIDTTDMDADEVFEKVLSVILSANNPAGAAVNNGGA